MSWVHYSWFAPFLRTLAEQEIKFFLSVFSEDQAKNLKESLLFSGKTLPLASVTKSFLQKKLIEYILKGKEDLLPIEALPSSPLSCLLEFNADKFHLLIEFLGLHDLSIEIKQIIDTIKLKKIHSFLSKEKLFFLQSLSHKKEPIVFKKMELTNWNGEEETLMNLLRKRGMNRLSKALYPENADLIWYITHRMSNEEALLFSALHKKLEQTKAYSLLANQVIELSSFLKTHNIQAES